MPYLNPHCFRTEALKRLQRLRETEEAEAQIKISALELKVHISLATCEPVGVLRGELTHLVLLCLRCVSLKLMEKSSEDSQDSEDQANVSTINSLMAQLEGMSLLWKTLLTMTYQFSSLTPKHLPPYVFREQEESEPAAAGENVGSPEASNTKTALPSKVHKSDSCKDCS